MNKPRFAPRLNLTWKFLVAFAIVALVGVTTVSVLANRATEREVRGFMFRGGMTDAGQLASELSQYYLQGGSWTGVEQLIGDRRGRGHMGGLGIPGSMQAMMNPELTLADAAGRVLASNTLDVGSVLEPAAAAEATPVVVAGQTVGLLLVSGAGGAAQGQDLIQRVNRAVWLAALAAAAVALLVGGLLIGGLLRPVRALTAAARGLASGDLGRRVPVTSEDEIGQLSTAFNQMAEALERAEGLRRDMTADVAHELRNPLAVMQARVEAILDGVYPPTPENLQPVLEQSQVLNRLVDDLRTLALADAGQLSLHAVPTDLGSWLQGAVESYRLQAELAGVSLRLESVLDREVRIRADPERMQQLLGNLLDNALGHTPAGGEVVVRAWCDKPAREAVLEVLDSGEGIPEEALPFVFERFYRADQGRSRREGGTGLGLAIARKIAQAHGGRISAANRPEGGASFGLRIPFAPL